MSRKENIMHFSSRNSLKVDHEGQLATRYFSKAIIAPISRPVKATVANVTGADSFLFGTEASKYVFRPEERGYLSAWSISVYREEARRGTNEKQRILY